MTSETLPRRSARRSGTASRSNGRPIAPRGRLARRRARQQLPLKIAMLLPCFALLIGFVLIPLQLGVKLSFFSWDGVAPVLKPVGIDNYTALWRDDRFIAALGRTVIWAVLHFVLAVGGALLLASLINEVKWSRVRAVFRSLAFLPNVLSLSVVGVIWSQIYSPNIGLLNRVLTDVGLPDWARSWLGDGSTALYAVGVASAWQGFGFYLVIFLAGMQVINPLLYEAAMLDGAGAWARFRHVTVPGLYNTMSLVIVLAFSNALKGFGTVWSMTGGGPENDTELASVYLWRKAFQSGQIGLAVAAGLTMAVITLIGVGALTYWRDRAGRARV